MEYYKFILEAENKYTFNVYWLPFENFIKAEKYAKENFSIVGGDNLCAFFNVFGKCASFKHNPYKHSGMYPGVNIPDVLEYSYVSHFEKLIKKEIVEKNWFTKAKNKTAKEFTEFVKENNIVSCYYIKTYEQDTIEGFKCVIEKEKAVIVEKFDEEIKEDLEFYLKTKLNKVEFEGKKLYVFD